MSVYRVSGSIEVFARNISFLVRSKKGLIYLLSCRHNKVSFHIKRSP